MKRGALLCSYAAFFVAASADASWVNGTKWPLTAGCPTQQCLNSETCDQTTNRCVPKYLWATSVDNAGTTTIRTRAGLSAISYSTVLAKTVELWGKWTYSQVTSQLCIQATNGASDGTRWMSINACPSSNAGCFTTPQGYNAINATDVANRGIWLTGTNWRHSTSTLALTTATYTLNNKHIFDADTEFNNNINWAENGDAQSYDYESVILHEAGHFAGVDHTDAFQGLASMNPNVNLGGVVRTLQTLDVADICTIYAVPPGQGGGGAQGDRCTVNAMGNTNCAQGLVCEAAPGTNTPICTRDCYVAGTQGCPAGFTCQASTNMFACLPQVGTVDLCAFCTTGSGCSTGLCLYDDTSGYSWCSMNCTTDGQCGAGYSCTGGYCIPAGNRCTGQCTSAGNCAPGYDCVGGTCTPVKTVGSRCEVHQLCNACSECILEDEVSGIAYCRQCCTAGAGGADRLCNGCMARTCPTGPPAERCATITNSTASVCVRQSGANLCQTCSTMDANSCAVGRCINGRCLETCNPSNPGQCGACAEMTSGNFYCACPEKVVRVGEACGPMASGEPLWCQNDLACVGSPQPRCRQRCDRNQPASCPTGQTCTGVGGQFVCVPPDTGQCMACNNGTCAPGLRCHQNRCYQPCVTTQPGNCTSCLAIDAANNGVCTCPDERVAVGQACASAPVRGCQPGAACFRSTCRSSCDPGNPTPCTGNQACTRYQDQHYCLDATGAGGSGGAGNEGGSTGGTGGTGGGSSSVCGPCASGLRCDASSRQCVVRTGGGGTVPPPDCNCSAGGPLGVFALLAMSLRRRRARS